jgi:hypothetical protein
LIVRVGIEDATCGHLEANAFIFGNAPTANSAARLAPTEKSSTFANPAAAALFASMEMSKAAAASAKLSIREAAVFVSTTAFGVLARIAADPRFVCTAKASQSVAFVAAALFAATAAKSTFVKTAKVQECASMELRVGRAKFAKAVRGAPTTN